MSTDTLYFPADMALEAMGNTSRRWQNHLDTNKIFIPPDVSFVSSFGPGRGKLRQVSIGAIIQGAIAFALIDCGVDVREAYRVGAQFAFFGEAGEHSAQDAAVSNRSPLTRNVGRLFAEGETFLIYSVGDLHPSQKRYDFVSDANPTFSKDQMLSAPRSIVRAVDGGEASPRILINVSQLCRNIAQSLGIGFTAAFLTESP